MTSRDSGEAVAATPSLRRVSLVEALAAAARLPEQQVRAKGFTRISEVESVLATLPPPVPYRRRGPLAAYARAGRRQMAAFRARTFGACGHGVRMICDSWSLPCLSR